MLAKSRETSLMPTIWFKDSDYTEYSHTTYSTNTLDAIDDWAMYREEYDILKCPSIVLLLELHKD